MAKILDRGRGTIDGLQPCLFLIDSEDELTELPTSTKEAGGFKKCAKGSLAMMFGDGDGAALYGLNGSDEWVKLRSL